MGSFESQVTRVNDSKNPDQSNFPSELMTSFSAASLPFKESTSFLPKLEITTESAMPTIESKDSGSSRKFANEEIQRTYEQMRSEGIATVETHCKENTFKPDYDRSSASAKQWEKFAQKLKQKPAEVDADGKYEVQMGDSLWGIAERVLKQRGEKAGAKEISTMAAQIENANKKDKCFLFIHPGDKILIPGQEQRAALEPQREEPKAAAIEPLKEQPAAVATSDSMPRKRGSTQQSQNDGTDEAPPTVQAIESQAPVAILEAKPKDFAYARKIELPDSLIPRTFKGSGPENSMVIEIKEGTLTYWADGTVRMNKKDGSGFVYKPDASAGYSYKHWGGEGQNYEVTYNWKEDTVVETDNNGTKRTVWRDDTVRTENPDNTGSVERHRNDGTVDAHRWEGNKKHQRLNERLKA